jgi:hypothetical protein
LIAVASAIYIIGFGAGIADVCGLTALSLHSSYKVPMQATRANASCPDIAKSVNKCVSDGSPWIVYHAHVPSYFPPGAHVPPTSRQGICPNIRAIKNPTSESGSKRKNGPERLLQKLLKGWSIGCFNIDITPTRHDERPFGLLAGDVREIRQRERGRWIELWAWSDMKRE